VLLENNSRALLKELYIKMLNEKNTSLLLLFLLSCLAGVVITQGIDEKLIRLDIIQYTYAQKSQDATSIGKDTGYTKYIETAKQLLNQTSLEYKKGNSTGAEELATRAYLDNFEYIEPILERHGAADLKEQIEQLMRLQLRDMIKEKASQEQIDSLINTIYLKLSEAATQLG
jgi:hypothetical protein